MARRRRYYEEEPEEAVELGEVLEPYAEEAWEDEQADYVLPDEEYYDEDGYAVEYSEEHEAADHESRFRIAIGAFDLASTIVGILVILLLVAMLLTLLNWLKGDVQQTALLMQSGLQ